MAVPLCRAREQNYNSLMSQPNVLLLTTGGTIAISASGELLKGPQLLEGIEKNLPAHVTVETFADRPSAHFSIEHVWNLRNHVLEQAQSGKWSGIVLTHGTDTMEETAYLLDLTCDTEIPIILTGAMRTPHRAGADGPANVSAAIRVAAEENARGRGAMIVLHDEIHSARTVTKSTANNVTAFSSPRWGPMGVIEPNRIHWGWNREREIIAPQQLNNDVHLLKVALDADVFVLNALIEKPVAALVIEAFGSSRIPPAWAQAVERATGRGITVAIVSRTGSGDSYDTYPYEGAYNDLKARGAIFLDDITGPKARLKLMAQLGAVVSLNEEIA